MGMMIVEILIRIEEEFELEIPDVDAEELSTVGAMADYVAGIIPWRGREEIMQRVRVVVADEVSMPLEQVRPESRFVEDLGVA